MSGRPDLLLLFPPAAALPDGAAWEARLAERFTVHRGFGPDAERTWREAGPRVRAAVGSGSRGLSGEELKRLPALEIVALFGVGLDTMDMAAARARGVAVTTAPVLTDDVADLALALWLDASRRTAEGDRFVREGRWARERFPLARRAGGKRAGVFGLGRIGRAIARRLEGFGCEIAYASRSPAPDLPYARLPDLPVLARWADALFLAAPGGPETDGIVDPAVLEALGPNGVLVNIARGSLVDEAALADALEAGRLGAAGLDVFADEPRVSDRLLHAPRCVLSPHAGSATVETRRDMADAVLANLHAWLEGRDPPDRVG